jgi:hypothetical protein
LNQVSGPWIPLNSLHFASDLELAQNLFCSATRIDWTRILNSGSRLKRLNQQQTNPYFGGFDYVSFLARSRQTEPAKQSPEDSRMDNEQIWSDLRLQALRLEETALERWLGSSEHRFAFYKWKLYRVGF